MSKPLLANPLAQMPHIAVFDEIFADRIAALDTSRILTNAVSIVEETALVWLARQFGIMGNEGWNFCTTTQQRRDLVLAAIELHKHKGTPWAISNAIERGTVDIQDALITYIEGGDASGIVRYLDGSWFLNGTFFLGHIGHWAEFSVVIDSDSLTLLDETIYNLVLALIEEYQPKRSELVDLILAKTFGDSSVVDDGTIDFEIGTAIDDLLTIDDTGLSLTPTTLAAPAPIVTSGLIGYWDARDGVSTDGSGNVQQWDDLYGTCGDAYQGVAGLRPLLTADSDSIPCIYFDGTQNLRTAYSLAANVTMIVVMAPELSPGGPFIGSRVSGAAGGCYITIADTDFDSAFGEITASARMGATLQTVTSSVPSTTGKKMVSFRAHSSGTYDVWTNGTTGSSVAYSGATAAADMYFGGVDASTMTECTVYAVAIYNRRLSNTEITDMFAWMQSQFSF